MKLLGTLVLVMGCSESGPPVGRVSGTVTLDGAGGSQFQVIASGVPVPGGEVPVRGSISNQDGEFDPERVRSFVQYTLQRSVGEFTEAQVADIVSVKDTDRAVDAFIQILEHNVSGARWAGSEPPPLPSPGPKAAAARRVQASPWWTRPASNSSGGSRPMTAACDCNPSCSAQMKRTAGSR